MTSRSAVSNVLRGLNVNNINPYKNADSIVVEHLDSKHKITGDKMVVNSTRDITSNNNRINKTYYVKFNTTTKKILLSEDETNWFSENYTLTLYAGATYTFIQKNTTEYNNNTNPFLISTKNIYEKPRLTPLYNDNITYQIYNTNLSQWTSISGADPDGLVRTSSYYTQPFSATITQRKIIFSPTQHKLIFYITEQFTNPNITGGMLNVKPNNYKYGSAITNSGMGVKYDLKSGKSFMIDDIFIVNNTNTIYTTDKINTSYPLPDHYKILVGIGTNNSRASLDIGNTTSAMRLPSGNDTTDKPSGITGMIRYNNEIKDYEGKGSQDWGTLGGIQDIDMDTKIVIEPGQPGDNLASLNFITQGTSELFLDYRGASINHTNTAAMLDIKGNLALSNHNVGGVLFGADTSNTDNYLNITVSNNTSNSIDISSLNGGMITQIKKNIVENINENRTSILGSNTETIHGYRNNIYYNNNTLKNNSSVNKTIHGINIETFKNSSTSIFNNLNIIIGQNSVENYNTSVPITNTNSNKITNIKNLHNLKILYNKNETVKNNHSTHILGDNNNTFNLYLNETVSKNCNTQINQNLNIDYNNSFIENLKYKNSNFLSTYKAVYEKGITNNFKDTLSNTTNGNISLQINYNNNLIVNNCSSTIKNLQLNICSNLNQDTYSNSNIISKSAYTIMNNINKNVYNIGDNIKTYGAEKLTVNDNINIKYNKDMNNIINNLDSINNKLYNKFIKKESVITTNDNFNLNQKNIDINYNSSKTKIVNGITEYNYLNNYNVDYHINRNVNVSTDLNKYLKDKSTIYYNQSNTQILNDNNTLNIFGNNIINIYNKNTQSIDGAVFKTFKNNVNTVIDFNKKLNIGGTHNLVCNKIFNKKNYNDFNLTISNNMSQTINGSNTINFVSNYNISIGSSNYETYKNNVLKTSLYKDEIIHGNSIVNKSVTSTLLINHNNTESINADNNRTIHNNNLTKVKYNLNIFNNSLNKSTNNSTLHVKNSLTETIGTNTSNNINNYIKSNFNKIFDNDVIETIKLESSHNTLGNIQINLNSDLTRTINNNNDVIYKGTKLNVIKNNLTETITGANNITLSNDVEIIQYNGEIEIKAK